MQVPFIIAGTAQHQTSSFLGCRTPACRHGEQQVHAERSLLPVVLEGPLLLLCVPASPTTISKDSLRPFLKEAGSLFKESTRVRSRRPGSPLSILVTVVTPET